MPVVHLLLGQDELVRPGVFGVRRCGVDDQRRLRCAARFLMIRHVEEHPLDLCSRALQGCLNRPIDGRAVADDCRIQLLMLLHPFTPLALVPTMTGYTVEIV